MHAKIPANTGLPPVEFGGVFGQGRNRAGRHVRQGVDPRSANAAHAARSDARLCRTQGLANRVDSRGNRLRRKDASASRGIATRRPPEGNRCHRRVAARSLGTVACRPQDFTNVSANLSGIDALQAAAQEHMAAAWRIPLVKLTGISPSGLNASSEGEIRVYYDLIHSTQEHLLRPAIQIVLDLCQIELFGDVDPDITFEFDKLFEVTEVEAAQIRKTDADTGAVLIQSQVIDPQEERSRVAADPNTPYVDLDPMALPQAPAPQPGQEGYQADPNSWVKALSGIKDNGGLVPQQGGGGSD